MDSNKTKYVTEKLEVIKNKILLPIKNFKGFIKFSIKRFLFTHRVVIIKVLDIFLLRITINNIIKFSTALTEIPLSESLSYYQWLLKNYYRNSKLEEINQTLFLLKNQPLISIIIPVFHLNIKELEETLESVCEQIYAHWELCIACDDLTKEKITQLIKQNKFKDKIVKIYGENKDYFDFYQFALNQAEGDLIALLTANDLLSPDALYHVVVALNNNPTADMLYSDEDKIDQHQRLEEPHFKPDWACDSFLSRMYTGNLGVYQRALVEEIGGFRSEYQENQVYDLVLRLSEKTNKIIHIPKILYHSRLNELPISQAVNSEKYVISKIKTLENALERRKEKGKVITTPEGNQIIRYEILEFKKVSIIIPTRNLGKILNACLTSVFEKTEYPNYEVLVIDNGSTELETQEVIDYWKRTKPDKFKCEPLDIPFNFSIINNYAVERTTGDYLLFLNNDTEVINGDWLNAMVEQAQRPSIGAVGALLLYPDNTIQHAGVIMGFNGLADHSYKYYPMTSKGYFDQLYAINNYSAVTGACLMCRRKVFAEVGGFEEKLSVAFNDIDLCLKILELGYHNIYLPHVQLYHYESKTRGYDTTYEKYLRVEQEIKFMREKWQKYINKDPYYSVNLKLSYPSHLIRSK